MFTFGMKHEPYGIYQFSPKEMWDGANLVNYSAKEIYKLIAYVNAELRIKYALRWISVLQKSARLNLMRYLIWSTSSMMYMSEYVLDSKISRKRSNTCLFVDYSGYSLAINE